MTKFSWTPDSLEIFNAYGLILPDGSGWLHEVLETSTSPTIQRIAEQVTAGQADRVAVLLMAPREAVRLFLSGTLRCADLENAIVTTDFIEIPGVKIDDRLPTLTIRVFPHQDFATATADGEEMDTEPSTEGSATDTCQICGQTFEAASKKDASEMVGKHLISHF